MEAGHGTSTGASPVKAPSWPVLIGTAVLVAAAAIMALMFRLGVFKPVQIEHSQKTRSFTVLSRDHLGAYHKIAAVISDVEAWARAHGETCAVTFGQYFENPESTDEDRLHSRGGCVLSEPNKISELKALLAEPTTNALEMKIDTIEISDALVAVFDGSPSIGPMKVYSRMQEMMKEQDLRSSGPVLELYEVLSPTTGRTRYFFPVESLRK